MPPGVFMSAANRPASDLPPSTSTTPFAENSSAVDLHAAQRELALVELRLRRQLVERGRAADALTGLERARQVDAGDLPLGHAENWRPARAAGRACRAIRPGPRLRLCLACGRRGWARCASRRSASARNCRRTRARPCQRSVPLPRVSPSRKPQSNSEAENSLAVATPSRSGSRPRTAARAARRHRRT